MEEDRKVYEFYDVEDTVLGIGMHGPVYRVTNKESGKSYAMKSMRASDLKNDCDFDAIRNEVDILAFIDHPNIANLVEVFSSGVSMHMIIELCYGGELLDHLHQNGPYSERMAKKYIKEMLDVIRYLHGLNIVHCDLKLE